MFWVEVAIFHLSRLPDYGSGKCCDRRDYSNEPTDRIRDRVGMKSIFLPGSFYQEASQYESDPVNCFSNLSPSLERKSRSEASC